MRKKRWGARLLSLLLLGICMAGHLWLVCLGTRTLPEGVELSGEEELRLAGNQVDALEEQEAYSFVVTDLISIDSILAEGDFAGKEFADRNLYVEAWYTDSGFGRHSGLTLAEGTWPAAGDPEEFSQTVAISEDLAQTLFLRTDDVTGEMLQINGKSYRICGVYEKNESLPARMSEGRFDRIFLPYTDYEAAEDVWPVKYLYDWEGTARFPEKLSQELGTVLGQELPVLQTVDFAEYKALIAQTFRLALFVGGALLEAVLAARLWRFAFDGHHPLRKQGIGMGWRIGYVAGLLALMGLLAAVIAFPVTIPADYAPAENIFDVGWYLDVLVAGRQSENSRLIYSLYQGYAGRLLWLCVGFLAVEVMGMLQAALVWLGSRKE